MRILSRRNPASYNSPVDRLPSHVKVLDTTLRDGEQTPGVALKPDHKILIAQKLDDVGVDIIEAGMAITSAGEMESIKQIAKLGLKAEICSGCRASKRDIELSIDCDVDSIHLIVPTSEMHQQYKLKKTKEEVLDLTASCVEFAKQHGLIVEVSAEDGSRTPPERLVEMFRVGVEAGADRVCICDTVGIMTPEKNFQLFSTVIPQVKAPMSVHCHDDFGLGVANTIAGLRAGATEFHATINGIGERAGNASLEEVAVSLNQLYKVSLNLKIEKLYELSQLVSRLTKVLVPPNKAIVGENSFTHESGIHTHGVLALPATYEPIPPEVVGRIRRIVAGKHAGSHAIKVMLDELGYKPTEDQFNKIFAEVKRLGDMGKRVTDADLSTIAETVMGISPEKYVVVEELTAVTGNKVTPMASVRVKVNGKEYLESGLGDGPVDAAINAIHKALTGVADIRLEKYEVEAISGGTDAVVDVSVQLRLGDRRVTAKGVSGDIVMASVEAMTAGMNKLLSLQTASKK